MKAEAVDGMATGMATTKVTVTLDVRQLEKVRSLVAGGKAANVSAFVKHAVAIALQDEAGWGVMLADALEQSGGPLTRRERDWADSILLRGRARPKRQRKAA